MKMLIETKDRQIQSWAEWKELWDSTGLLEVRLSLLFYGFEVSTDRDEATDRIKTYLQLADGWDESTDYFVREEERPDYKHVLHSSNYPDPWRIRKACARKAFEVLCAQLFKKGEDGWETLKRPGVLTAVLDFFLAPPAKEYLSRLRNFPYKEKTGDHHQLAAALFLERLVERFWNPGDRPTDEVLQLYPQIRVRLVEVLCYSGNALRLLEPPFRNCLDKECLRYLKQLAMREKFLPLCERDIRKPRTLDEAIHAGSVPAMALHLIQVRQAEEDRQREIAQLKHKQEAGRGRLKALQGG